VIRGKNNVVRAAFRIYTGRRRFRRCQGGTVPGRFSSSFHFHTAPVARRDSG
jgi:hypothetical protein